MSTRVTRLLAPNPGVYTLEGTNTWVVGDGPAVVIDPGPDNAEHLQAVLDAAGTVGLILLTHDHEDHAEGATRLSQMSGAPVRGGAVGTGEPLADGAAIVSGTVELRAVHAPGHTRDSFVFRLTQTGAMFTGDTVLGQGTSVIDPPEGDLVAYLASLQRLLDLEPATLFPGHGPTIFAGRLKLQQYLDHRADRELQVLKAMATGERTVEAMVREIYADHPQEVYPLAARSVLAHLNKLETEGVVESVRSSGAIHYRKVRVLVCIRCGKPVRGKATLCARCSMDALQEAPE